MTLTVKRARQPVRLYIYVVTDEIGQVYGAHGSMDTAIDQFYKVCADREQLGWERPGTMPAEPESQWTLDNVRRMLSTQVRSKADKGRYFWTGFISINRVRVTPPRPNEERTTFLPKAASEFVMEVTEVTRA